MVRERNRLTALQVRKQTAPGRYGDGGGLHLYIGKHGAKAWVFRYTDRRTGKLRDMGLGNALDVTLEHARQRAHAARLHLLDGRDPIDERNAERETQRIEHAKRLTFWQCAEKYIAAHRAGWRSVKHADQWTATLTTYAKPINSLHVAKIDTALVLKCLEPHWSAKAETMTRVRQRIEAVLDWATVRGYRKGENPARWKGHLDHLLPKRSKVAKVQHHAALPYADVPAFMLDLRKRPGLAALVLELQILTATRPGEAAGAQWTEIDLDGAVWTIPAARMKASAEHRVPLSKPAVALLQSLPRIDGNVFPGVKGRPITTAASMAMLKDLRPGVTAHGFRSTFRDWAGDCTSCPREIVEAALAHTIKDKTEAAYRRGDAFQHRARLMADWANYTATPAPAGNVTPLKGARKASGGIR